MHADCHWADLAFRDAMDAAHEFLDTVADSMTAMVHWFRNAPTCLRNLRCMAISLDTSPLQYTSFSQRRWVAFAGAVRALLWCAIRHMQHRMRTTYKALANAESGECTILQGMLLSFESE